MTAGRDLPWLQDTPQEDVWGSWQVAFRDVLVLDEHNAYVTAFNLTQNSLDDPANYDALKQLLIDTIAP